VLSTGGAEYRGAQYRGCSVQGVLSTGGAQYRGAHFFHADGQKDRQI